MCYNTQLAGSLVQKGAHLIAVAAFLTTLTMVGLVTMPIEIEHFDKKFAIIRNFGGNSGLRGKLASLLIGSVSADFVSIKEES